MTTTNAEGQSSSRSAPTRLQLVLTAERLYAELGLEGVSLREIAAAAGQGNNAAVQYHFGNREGLVRAVFEHRFAQLDERRADLLMALDERGDTHLRSLLQILILPFADGVDGSGRHWIRFLARLHEDPRYNPFAVAVNQPGAAPYAVSAGVLAATLETVVRIRRAVDLSDLEVTRRLYLVTTMVVHAVADREALVAAGAADMLGRVDEFLDDLVDAAEAILTS